MRIPVQLTTVPALATMLVLASFADNCNRPRVLATLISVPIEGLAVANQSKDRCRPLTAGRGFSKLPLAATADVAKAVVRYDRAILAA